MSPAIIRREAIERIQELKASAADALAAYADSIKVATENGVIDPVLERTLFHLAVSRADSCLRQAEITRIANNLPRDHDLPFVPRSPADMGRAA